MPYTKQRIISKPNYRVDFFEERNKTLAVKDRAIFEDVRDIEDILSHHIHKILLIENDPVKYKQVKEHFENMNKFTIATSQKGFIDINPKGASKGKALAVLATHFGVSLDEVVVFGDQDNDVSMLKLAGTSVVMANGSKKAKEGANYITISKTIRDSLLGLVNI